MRSASGSAASAGRACAKSRRERLSNSARHLNASGCYRTIARDTLEKAMNSTEKRNDTAVAAPGAAAHIGETLIVSEYESPRSEIEERIDMRQKVLLAILCIAAM